MLSWWICVQASQITISFPSMGDAKVLSLSIFVTFTFMPFPWQAAGRFPAEAIFIYQNMDKNSFKSRWLSYWNWIGLAPTIFVSDVYGNGLALANLIEIRHAWSGFSISTAKMICEFLGWYNRRDDQRFTLAMFLQLPHSSQARSWQHTVYQTPARLLSSSTSNMWSGKGSPISWRPACLVNLWGSSFKP